MFCRTVKSISLLVAAILTISIAHGTPAVALDRLQGMAEPVVGKKAYRIAYASIDMNSDFFIGQAYGLTDEAKLAKVEIVRIVSAGGYGKVAEQVAQLEQLASLNPDAIILGGAAFNGYDKVVQRLVDRGIKVVTLGSSINAPGVSFGVLQNEKAVGAALGAAVCKLKPNAKVGTLPGPAGVEWSRLRFEGFQAEAAKCNETMVGNTFEGNVSIEEGQRQAGDLLVKNPDLDYIYAAPGIFAVGAAQQALRMNKKVPVVSGAITRRTIDLLKEGAIAVVLSEPPILRGRIALQYTVRLLNGDPMPNLVQGMVPYPALVTPNVPVTADTLRTYDPDAYDLPPQGWMPAVLQ